MTPQEILSLAGHGYKLVAIRSGYVDVSTDVIPLQQNNGNDLPCDYVILSNWNVEDDVTGTPKPRDATEAYDTTGEEIYWGAGQMVAHPVFPQDTTYMIGVNNISDISVRRSPNKTVDAVSRIFWTAFKLMPIKVEETTTNV